MTAPTHKKTSQSHLLLACVAIASLAVPSEARGASLVPRSLYQFHRRPNTLDLMGDIFTMPIYFNSLMKQQEGQVDRLYRSSPRYHIEEGPQGSELIVEVPGVSQKNLTVELEDENLLRISGIRRYQQQGEATESKFEQLFRLDDDADAENLSVTLENGILHITAPKKDKVVRKLPIASLDDPESEAIETQVVSKEEIPGEVKNLDGLAITEEKI